MKERYVFKFKGCVERKIDGRILDHNYVAETYAANEAEARNNLTYRWRKENSYTTSYNVILNGVFEQEE